MGFETKNHLNIFTKKTEFEVSLWDLKRDPQEVQNVNFEFEVSLWDLKRFSLISRALFSIYLKYPYGI